MLTFVLGEKSEDGSEWKEKAVKPFSMSKLQGSARHDGNGVKER